MARRSNADIALKLFQLVGMPAEHVDRYALKWSKTIQPPKAPYAVVKENPNKKRSPVVAVFGDAKSAYDASQRLEGHTASWDEQLVAIYVPTLAHVGQRIHRADIGGVYRLLEEGENHGGQKTNPKD